MSRPPQYTPLARNGRVFHANSLIGDLTRVTLLDYRAQAVEDMARRAVRVEAEQFIQDFLVSSKVSEEPPTQNTNPFRSLEHAEVWDEATISARLTSAINDQQQMLMPDLKMCLSEHRSDAATVDPLGQKIDGRLVPSDAEDDGRPHYADQLVGVEYKSFHFDPYDDKTDSPEATGDKRKQARGQIIHYAELVFSIQQRTHFIMIVIVGRRFRLLRWDRSGVIVSKAVDYYENWNVFCKALWWISMLAKYDRAALGFDESAERIVPGSAAWTLMEEAAKKRSTDVNEQERVLSPDELTGSEPYEFEYVRKLFRSSLQQDWPRYELHVPDGDKTRTFYVAKPYFQAPGMTGRGTRGYVALESGTGRFRWLKDAWRVNYKKLRQEGAILGELNSKGVSNIPTLVCHGDIGEQVTKTPDVWKSQQPPPSRPATPSPADPLHHASGSRSENLKRKYAEEDEGEDEDEDDLEIFQCPLRRHRHYRIVVEEVCMTLPMFQSGKQLVSIVYDCAVGHYKAYEAGILHRDISDGNILIFPKVVELRNGRRYLRWSGVLADWELARGILEKLKARQATRTGTWQFLSIAILDDHCKVVEMCDEQESFLYVIVYHAVRYLPSNCQDVAQWIEDFFDCYQVIDDVYSCGDKKRAAVAQGRLFVQPGVPLRFESPLDDLLTILFHSFHCHYAVRKYDAQPKYLGPAATVKVATASSSEDAPQELPFDDTEEMDVFFSMIEEHVPTDAERKNAENVSNPGKFVKILRMSCSRTDWPQQSPDMVKDRVSKEWRSARRIGPIENKVDTKRRAAGKFSVHEMLQSQSPERKGAVSRQVKSTGVPFKRSRRS